jgi:hypothetical protein
MTDKRFEEIAKRAVGVELLLHTSPGGGSHGNGIDEQRADLLAAERLDGEALYALMLNIANAAAKDTERYASSRSRRIIEHVRRLAEKTDSLALHRFIEAEAKEQ